MLVQDALKSTFRRWVGIVIATLRPAKDVADGRATGDQKADLVVPAWLFKPAQDAGVQGNDVVPKGIAPILSFVLQGIKGMVAPCSVFGLLGQGIEQQVDARAKLLGCAVRRCHK